MNYSDIKLNISLDGVSGLDCYKCSWYRYGIIFTNEGGNSYCKVPEDGITDTNLIGFHTCDGFCEVSLVYVFSFVNYMVS